MNIESIKTGCFKTLAFSLTLGALVALTGCGGASTNINERDPLPADDDGHGHGDGDGHGGGTPDGHATGRLLVVNSATTEAQVYDLEDSDLITTITMDALPSAVYATGGFRYAALIERNADKVSFIDGGLWQEAHDDHFDLFTAMPSLLNFSLTGSRPTHFVKNEGQVALFLDGDSGAGTNAGVMVFDDHEIEEEEAPISVEFTMPHHGVAEPRGEHLITSIRRGDSLTTSVNPVLPDQVGVYHLHEGEFELEQTFDTACPDLHGAAQNETYVIFGCSDGVLIVTDNGDDTYSAQKVANPDEMEDGLRIGSVWGHHDSGQFIGQASSRDSDTVQFFAIEPSENEMELIDWQPMTDAKPVVRGFAYKAEQFVILDNQGYLTAIEPHDEGGHTHWEFGARLDFTEADVSTMPEGARFSMTFAQNGHSVYVADPIEQHVLIVDLEMLEVTGDIELDYAPSMVTWLGIAEEGDHDHDHDH